MHKKIPTLESGYPGAAVSVTASPLGTSRFCHHKTNVLTEVDFFMFVFSFLEYC